MKKIANRIYFVTPREVGRPPRLDLGFVKEIRFSLSRSTDSPLSPAAGVGQEISSLQ